MKHFSIWQDDFTRGLVEDVARPAMEAHLLPLSRCRES